MKTLNLYHREHIYSNQRFRYIRSFTELLITKNARMNNMNKNIFLFFCTIFFVSCAFVQAQKPLIFKVKKPDYRIQITPPGDVFYMGINNQICITTAYTEIPLLVEVSGATVIPQKNNCYIIRFKNHKVRDVHSKLTGGLSYNHYYGPTTLSLYLKFPDKKLKLIFSKKYIVWSDG